MPSRAHSRSDRRRHALAAGSRTCTVALAAAMLASVAQAEAAGIFQIDDAPGEIHLSDRADADAGVTVRRLVGTVATSRPAARRPGDGRFDEIIRQAAVSQGIPPALIDALISVESAYRVRAVSPRGAAGLMQLMPATARFYGVTDVFDPAQNIAAGARHLRGLLDRYDQDVTRALAAYNAGAGAVQRAAALGLAWPSAETAAYVPAVLGRYAALGSTDSPGDQR